MIDGENCDACSAPLSTDRHWSVCIEDQKCIWEAPDSMPVVDVSEAYCLGSFCSEKHAMETIDNYLMQVGAEAFSSDVRPTETCACCKNDFNTATRHKALALLIERGSIYAPETIDVEYVARFCPKCVP